MGRRSVYQIGGWGQKLAEFDDADSDRHLPASDAPEVVLPGHRRDKIYRAETLFIAALPQPPAA